jgi:hypothetical protein
MTPLPTVFNPVELCRRLMRTMRTIHGKHRVLYYFLSFFTLLSYAWALALPVMTGNSSSQSSYTIGGNGDDENNAAMIMGSTVKCVKGTGSAAAAAFGIFGGALVNIGLTLLSALRVYQLPYLTTISSKYMVYVIGSVLSWFFGFIAWAGGASATSKCLAAHSDRDMGGFVPAALAGWFLSVACVAVATLFRFDTTVGVAKPTASTGATGIGAFFSL